MQKKIIYTISIIAVITIAGLFAYFLAQKATILVNSRSNYLEEKYQETDKVSYLLELKIINPNQNHEKRLINQLLRHGNYNAAYIINLFVNLDNFNLKITETAIETNNKFIEDKYIERLNLNEKAELEAFIKLNSSNNTEIIINNPNTNLGKITKMTLGNDFSIYNVDSIIGNEISKLVDTYPKRTEQSLAIAKLFNEFGFYNTSKLVSENIIVDTGCIKDAYIVNAESFRLNTKPSEAQASLERYLGCDPRDQEVLRLLLIDTQINKDSVKEDIYTNKLKLLSEIDN